MINQHNGSVEQASGRSGSDVPAHGKSTYIQMSRMTKLGHKIKHIHTRAHTHPQERGAGHSMQT